LFGAPQGHFLRGAPGEIRTPDRAIEPDALDDWIVMTATRFEEVTVENQPNRNSKLDGLPSFNLLPNAIESR
jgi:hypothetical protein